MGKINIPSIKSSIVSILEAANTTTASPIDLSDGMSKRVLKVASIHPEDIIPQATVMPFVTVFTERKPITQRTIAKNMTSAKREGRLVFTIAGMVWNQNFQSNIWQDPADNDLEHLMENIEEVLRGSPDLGGLANWHVPIDTTYHNAVFDEQTHFKVGFFQLEAAIFY